MESWGRQLSRLFHKTSFTSSPQKNGKNIFLQCIKDKQANMAQSLNERVC